MFIAQVAMVKGGGGIVAAACHYARMFSAAGVRSLLAYRGPPAPALIEFDMIEAPAALASPLGAVLPLADALGRAIAAHGAPDAIIVHSDKALPSLRRMFPRARLATPCHSDKFKHKAGADLVITLNGQQDALARQALPRTRIAMLGNPYVTPAAARLAPADGVPRINFVARFIADKDPLTLMRAAGAAARPDLEFRFIGAGPLEGELRAAAAELNVKATFPGWLESPFAAFHRNDILVAPSAWEGLPYLLQEALDRGVPIVASDIAGHRAALNEGAFGALFQQGDAQALANAIAAALGGLDALRAKAEKGRAALPARYGAAAFWQALQRELSGCAHA